MSCWDGFGPPGRDEDGDEWEESEDEDETGPQPWRGEEHPLDADDWKGWPEDLAGPEYWLYRDDAEG